MQTELLAKAEELRAQIHVSLQMLQELIDEAGKTKQTAGASASPKTTKVASKLQAKPAAEVTLESIKPQFLAFIQSAGQAEALRVLRTFGVSKLSELPAERLPEFKASLDFLQED